MRYGGGYWTTDGNVNERTSLESLNLQRFKARQNSYHRLHIYVVVTRFDYLSVTEKHACNYTASFIPITPPSKRSQNAPAKAC